MVTKETRNDAFRVFFSVIFLKIFLLFFFSTSMAFHVFWIRKTVHIPTYKRWSGGHDFINLMTKKT